MKKNHGFPYKWGIKMRYVLLVLQVALFLPQWGHASNNVLLPGPKISFSMKDALMKDVIWELEKRSGFVFAYNANDLLKAGKVSVEVKDKDVYEALDICLKGTGLTYVVQQDVIVIKRADAPVQEVKKVTITGRVVDKDSLPLPGVTILLKHTTMGVVTDQNGRYSITIPDVQEPVLIFTFVGMKSREVKYTGNNVINIVLEDDVTEVEEVVVTAQPTGAGSTSKIGEEAIRHIQPMSIGDMFQLLPGNLSVNPNLNGVGQAAIREIGSNANNALGAAVIVDGAPLSNDGNLQALSPSLAGSASNQSQNGMSDQTTAGKGVDLRSVSPDNVESMEVIRGIPSVEYGNLTSGVVIVKTKTGSTPWEAKFKADPYSKMVYAGKGFTLKNGSAINAGIDWTQSFGDTRKRYLGYDRISATLGYSKSFDVAGRPMFLRLNGSFYSNVNNSKTDPQMQVTSSTFKNKSIGARLNAEGSWKINGAALTALEYGFMVSQAYQSDRLHEYVASASGVISNTLKPGVYEGIFLPSSYYSDYEIEGKPLSVYLQVKANKIIQLGGGGGSFTNLRAGVDWRYDANYGGGLLYDINKPPQSISSQTLRPRSFRDIPALNNLAFFFEDRLNLKIGGTSLALQAGVRLTNMFLDPQAGQNDIFVAEPRVNLNYSLYEGPKAAVAVTGGWGLQDAHAALPLSGQRLFRPRQSGEDFQCRSDEFIGRSDDRCPD